MTLVSFLLDDHNIVGRKPVAVSLEALI